MIEVNPRHKAFYRRMLDFQPHGEERLHRSVGAPAVLMSLSLAYGATQVRKFGGTLNEDGRSRTLFPYFFSPRTSPSCWANSPTSTVTTPDGRVGARAAAVQR